MKNLLRLIAAVASASAIIALAGACSDEEDCSLAARPMMQCNLYTIDQETGLRQRDTLDEVTVTAAGTDSVIVNRQTEVRELSLPLCYTVDSTKLVLHYAESAETDTVVIRHSNTPYFLSMDCGYQMKQSISAVRYTRHFLDSIHINNAEAGIYARENLQLFY